MYCPKCKKLVLQGDTCCGEPLPGSLPPPRIKGRQQLLQQAVLHYRTGDISREELLAKIDQEYRQCEKLLKSLPTPDEFGQDTITMMQEELSIGSRGIQTYIQALELIREWIKAPHDNLLKTALAMAEQADTLVNEAVQINWETHKTLIDSTREFLKQMSS